MFAQCLTGASQLEKNIDLLLQCCRALREMTQRATGLLESLDRFSVRATSHGLGARLTQIDDGPLPLLTANSMIGKPLHVLTDSVSMKPLDGIYYPGVQRTSMFLEKRSVGYLMGESMLEGVLYLGEETRL